MADESRPAGSAESGQTSPERSEPGASHDEPQETATEAAHNDEARAPESAGQEAGEDEREPAHASQQAGPAGEEIRRVSPRERKGINRRELLKLVPVVAVGAFAIPKLQDSLLMGGLHLSDWASGKLFGRDRLAPEFRNSQVAPFARFPYNYYDVLDPDVDLERWTLTVEGLVKRPGDYKLEQIQALPKVVRNTRHVCVEGWDVIGNFGGTRGSDFLRWLGADLTAKYLEVYCVDDYYESIDMATMLHPQTLFCYEMYGQPLDRGHGAPLRLQMPTKLGYKQAKYLDIIRVTNVLKPGKQGYWEDQGYDWYGGL